MTTKEKAKAYDEAIERAKIWQNHLYDTNDKDYADELNYIFPELKESENERISKEIINFLELPHPQFVGKRYQEDWIAWLEKQCKKDEEILILKDQIESLHAAIEAVKETHRIELEKQSECHISHDDEIMIKQLIEYFTTGHKLQNTNETVVEFLKDVKEKLEKKGNLMSALQEANKKIGELVEENYYLKEQGEQKSNPILDIEIPFGAKDSELQEASYHIPEGFHVEIEGNRVVIKRGEQKPVDKVEPKFKIGDWVVYNDNVYQIHNISLEKYYECLRTDGTVHTFDFEYIDSKSHLWTIQDAKDGDVLACNEEILLFKSYSVQGRISLYCWYNGQTNNFHSKEVVGTLLTRRNKIYPATKEQRDLLFKKMKEERYTFDFEKKELKKIEQKPAWSKEDEDYYDVIITKLEITKDDALLSDNELEFLKSLKDRVQSKREWKQENTDDLTNFENAMMHIGNSFFGKNAGLDPNDTNAIKEQANILLGLVTKQEWSEEDIEMINWLIRCCEKEHEELCNDRYGHQEIVSDLKRDCRKKWDWLESLKNKVVPQNRWKPSEEQIMALRWVLNHIPYDSHKEEISGLLEQLKELK